MNRRNFVLTAAAASATPAFPAAQTVSPSDVLQMAVVGVGDRGLEHIQSLARIPETRITAICDVDQTRADRAVQLVEKLKGYRPKTYKRIDTLLEAKDVDALSMATCNLWHALGTIWACQAGKDVLIEKPASHSIWEGRKMVEAARKYGRIVQAVHQSRAITHIREGIEALEGGAIGKVYMARGICFRRRQSIGRKPDGPVPPGIDHSYWLGPAPMRPFNPNRFHYNWHWFWDTGNGEIGNQGVHQLDIARWGLGRGIASRVSASGGKYVWDDDQQTPNTLQVLYEYGDVELSFEVRNLPSQNEGGIHIRGESYIGNIFYGGDGYMEVDNVSTRIFRGSKLEREIKATDRGNDDTIRLMRNFLTAVKSRNYKELMFDIEEGHRSAALSHLANISYHTGRKLQFDNAKENFGADKQANAMLKREYRKPYVIPEKV